MLKTMEHLLELQALVLQPEIHRSAAKTRIQQLRQDVPEPILSHFDRLVARGKRAIALVRNGVCNECHLGLSSGALADLAYASDVHLCDNCGRYLYLPATEPLGLSEPPPKPEAKKRHKGSVHAH
jgi:predicted  nucleic acid-binding Zn-ribbon protein